MLGTRVIPCLLLKNAGLVKTVKFQDPKYLGDPINIVRIFMMPYEWRCWNAEANECSDPTMP